MSSPEEEKNQEYIPEEIKKPGLFGKLYTRRRWFEALALILILCIGLFVRLEDLDDWKERPSEAFYQNEPLLTCFDGYYYLNFTRDLLWGNYDRIDWKRDVPDGTERPFPPPLLSVVTAGIAKISPYSLNWIAAVLPAFIGVLLAVPLYAMGRFYGGAAMGLTAALVGVVSPFYAYKSGLGWFDTDIMNVTWVMAIAWCALWFGVEKTVRRYWYFALGLIVSFLFYWWWDWDSGSYV
ncbi:MAG: STT3 domain-containing protein, partial [Desulfonatronovibrio sp.]